jgi:periplasmic protein TonB
MSTPTSPFQEKDEARELLTPEGRFLVGIRKDAIRSLRRLTYEGFHTIPQKPRLEFGGLCVASKPVASVSLDTIVDFVPVKIQYQYGPRFRPCPADRAVFEEAAKQQVEGGSRIVGCFRSHLADDLQIRQEDQWLMNVLFGERGGFLMLVQPTLHEVSLFRFGADGAALDTLPVARFSLRDDGPEGEKPSPRLEPGEPASMADAPREGIAAIPAGVPRPTPPPAASAIAAKTPPNSTKNIWLVSLGLVSLALAIFTVVLHAPSPATETGLAISSKGNTVEITWNVSSPAVKRALRGTLFATDHLNSSRVNLTAAQVHAGHYEYPHAVGDVFCEITLYESDHTFVGETKTIRLNAAAGAGPTSPAPRQQPAPASAGALQLKPQPDYDPAAAADSDPDSGETFVVKNSRAPFVPPPATERVRGPVIAKPPEVQSNPAPITTALPPVLMALKPPEPTVTPPARTAPAVIPSVTFTAPVPVKRVSPVVPSGVRPLLREPAVVTVVVEVDAEGKVTAARSSGDNTGIRQLLVPSAVQAAKLWQFEPALRNGVPVASQTEVSFRFANP